MDQVTVLEMALTLVPEKGLEKEPRLVLGMGQEMGQEMGLATVRDLVQVSENH
jgi:hypothetical protein